MSSVAWHEEPDGVTDCVLSIFNTSTVVDTESDSQSLDPAFDSLDKVDQAP
jgi:hypothetical protein